MAWKLIYQFRAVGTPRPGGSKRAVLNKKTGRIMVFDDCAENKTWRQDVKEAAIQATRPGAALLDGCLMLDVTFLLTRPTGHFGTGQNCARIKGSAPPYPNTSPDATKLVRSTEDALTGILWVDDARITDQTARKRYCDPGQAPGAEISISVWERDPGAVLPAPQSPLFQVPQ